MIDPDKFHLLAQKQLAAALQAEDAMKAVRTAEHAREEACKARDAAGRAFRDYVAQHAQMDQLPSLLSQF